VGLVKTNNLKQWALAGHNFHDARGGIVPVYLTGLGHATWYTMLMPYIEQAATFERLYTEGTASIAVS
jgi:hypothetical protein